MINIAPPFTTNPSIMEHTDANYNYLLLLRGIGDRDVKNYVRRKGYNSVPGLYELSLKMSEEPMEWRELFYLLDKHHEPSID